MKMIQQLSRNIQTFASMLNQTAAPQLAYAHTEHALFTETRQKNTQPELATIMLEVKPSVCSNPHLNKTRRSQRRLNNQHREQNTSQDTDVQTPSQTWRYGGFIGTFLGMFTGFR